MEGAAAHEDWAEEKEVVVDEVKMSEVADSAEQAARGNSTIHHIVLLFLLPIFFFCADLGEAPQPLLCRKRGKPKYLYQVLMIYFLFQ